MEAIKKFSRPTQYDQAMPGQIWVAELENGVALYIQTSSDKTSPHWATLGSFLEIVYKDKIDAGGIELATQIYLWLRKYDDNKPK